jgi:hypothetical protein
MDKWPIDQRFRKTFPSRLIDALQFTELAYNVAIIR